MGALNKIYQLFSPDERYGNPYFISRREHYSRMAVPGNLAEMIRLHKEGALREKYMYPGLIHFGGQEFGSPLKESIKTYGTPRYLLENTYRGAINHTILFYKKQLGKHDVISQLHFINDKLFWGLYLFRNKFNSAQLQDIEKALATKYTVAWKSTGIKNHCICDRHENKIFLKDDIYTSIHYVSGDSGIQDEIIARLNYFNRLSSVKSEEENNRLLDML